MKEINIDLWNRKKQFNWFNGFSNPCFSLNIKMDCTELVRFTKENKQSFFIDFMYLLMKAFNSVEEMRLRYIDGKVYLFDTINPAYTVMTKAGVFENVRHKMIEEHKEFYALARKSIDEAKELTKVSDEYNTLNYDEYYLTTAPWDDFVAMTHPIPDDKNSLSVPRVCWGKYVEENEKYFVSLNVTVSHALVDGYPVSVALKRLRENVENCKNILEKEV